MVQVHSQPPESASVFPGRVANRYDSLSSQSERFSVASFSVRYAGLSQSVEKMRHVIGIRNEVDLSYQGERAIQAEPLELSQCAMRFIETLEMREGGDQSHMSRPLKIRLAQRFARPVYGLVVLPQEQVGVGHAHQTRSPCTDRAG